MKVRIKFIDGYVEREFDVTSMGMRDGFITFSKDGEPTEEGGAPTLDFVYSVQAHLVREIENIDPSRSEQVFGEMLNATPSLPDKKVEEVSK